MFEHSSPQTLSELMIAYQAGKREAFRQLALRPTLASDLVSLGADPHSLEALVDEVFLAIHATSSCNTPRRARPDTATVAVGSKSLCPVA